MFAILGLMALGSNRIGSSVLASVLCWCFVLVIVGSLLVRLEAELQLQPEKD